MSEWMTTKAAEQYSGIGGLAKRRVMGNGPPFCKVGDRVVYERSAIDDWLKQQIYTSTSQAQQSGHRGSYNPPKGK